MQILFLALFISTSAFAAESSKKELDGVTYFYDCLDSVKNPDLAFTKNMPECTLVVRMPPNQKTEFSIIPAPWTVRSKPAARGL